MNTELRSIIADVLGLAPETVDASLSRETEERWDSLNHLRLVTAVEEAFGVKLSMAEIESVTTAGELQRLVGERAETE